MGRGDLRAAIDSMMTELYAAINATNLVSITGAISLDATAFGKIHLCSGTSADYVIDLPTAVGNAGKSIGFKGQTALTKLVTLDGFSTQEMDGTITLEVHPGRFAILISDGTNWIKTVDTHKVVSLCLVTTTASLVLTNQTLAVQFLGNSGGPIVKFDARRFTQIRITTRHITNGAANARLYPSYSVDGTTFTNPGTTTAGHADTISLGTGAVASKSSAWITLPLEARADILFAIRQEGGDGALDPAVGNTYIDFR